MARRTKGDGTLRKRKDGRWEGWFNIGKDENGKIKRKSVTAKTKAECQEKLKKAQADFYNEQNILSSHTYLTNSDPIDYHCKCNKESEKRIAQKENFW